MTDYRVAEYSVIGCVLIDEKCFPPVRQVLPSPEVFENGNCRRAYEAICALADSRKPIDPVTVGHRAGLENRFLAECMDLTPSCSGAEEYARAVKDGFRRRQLRQVGEQLQTGSFCGESDPEQLLAEARGALEDLANGADSAGVKGQSDTLQAFLVFREEVNEGKRREIKTGFPSLDGILGGFTQGGFYIIAARPGVGKSAFGIAMADMLAKEHRVLYVSLEMTEEELNARRVAAIIGGDCSYGKLLFGTTDEEENSAVINACSVLYERKLYLSAASSVTVAQLENQARSTQADVVIVDYLGLLQGKTPGAGEYERITQISGDLKRLAKQLRCVVIALCQLNRESSSTPGDKLPKLSQLRSSGAIEQDADGVLLLHRPEYGQSHPSRAPAAPQQFFVDIAKNRHGRTGATELAWYAPVNRFEDRGGRWTVKSWL